MMTNAEFQIKKEDYDFIKKFYKKLQYQSPDEYINNAVKSKIDADRKKIREMERASAMEIIEKTEYNHLFESLESEDFVMIHSSEAVSDRWQSEKISSG